MIPRRRQPTYPGKILLRDFLEPRKLTQMELARRMGVSIQRVKDVLPPPDKLAMPAAAPIK